MVQSAGLFSSCSCIIDPIANSCAYQTLSSLTQKVADFATGIFTAIAEFVKSWLFCTPAATVPTAQGPLPGFEEGKAFLRARVAHLDATTPDNRFREALRDDCEFRGAFATLVVHDLVMDRSSVAGDLPLFINRYIGNSPLTFIDIISRLHELFIQLSEEGRRDAIHRFESNQVVGNALIETPVDVLLNQAGQLAQQLAQMNPDFIACADVLRAECLRPTPPRTDPNPSVPLAGAGPVSAPDSAHVAEGKRFLEARLTHWIEMHGGNHFDTGRFMALIRDNVMGPHFLAALIVHDLAMDPFSVVGPLPHLVTCGIGETGTTFNSEIDQIRQKFSALSNEDKRIIKDTFLNLEALEYLAEPIHIEFFNAANETAQKFLESGLNPTFIESARAVLQNNDDFFARLLRDEHLAIDAEADSPAASQERKAFLKARVQSFMEDAQNSQRNHVETSADYVNGDTPLLDATKFIKSAAALLVFDLGMNRQSIEGPIPPDIDLMGPGPSSLLGQVEMLRSLFLKLTPEDKVTVAAQFLHTEVEDRKDPTPFSTSQGDEVYRAACDIARTVETSPAFRVIALELFHDYQREEQS